MLEQQCSCIQLTVSSSYFMVFKSFQWMKTSFLILVQGNGIIGVPLWNYKKLLRFRLVAIDGTIYSVKWLTSRRYNQITTMVLRAIPEQGHGNQQLFQQCYTGMRARRLNLPYREYCINCSEEENTVENFQALLQINHSLSSQWDLQRPKRVGLHMMPQKLH